MNDNEIRIAGNLTRDVEIKYTKTGKMICSLGLAYNHSKDRVSFFDIEAWEAIARQCEQLRKGQFVKIFGYLQQDRWPNKEGIMCSKIKVVAKEVEIIARTQRSEPQTNQGEEEIPF